MNVSVLCLYVYMGNTLSLSTLTLSTIMLNRIRSKLNLSQYLYRDYFNLMESMERLWLFYCAPESQRGLIDRRPAADSDDVALSIKGDFSWGVTPKLDQADKDAVKEKMKKQAYEKKTQGMGRLRKALFDLFPQETVTYQVPLKDRTLEQIISLKDLDISIKKGSFVVIVGATGSGKTSLLNAMIGEMIHLPSRVVKEVGDYKRPIKDGEMRYLEESLLAMDFTGASPIAACG